MPNEFWHGLMGGFFAELCGWWKIRREPTPLYCAHWVYWTTTVLMIISGGGLAFVYARSGLTLSPIIAVNIGASAPLIIGSLMGETPKLPKVPPKK